MSDGVEVRVTTNGPLTVKGPIRLVGSDGEAWADVPEGTVALCRCGRSKVRPFCDGSHREAGFDTDPGGAALPLVRGAVPTGRQPTVAAYSAPTTGRASSGQP